MALLDDLQSQVEKIREEEALRHSEIKEQEAYYDSHLKTVMRSVHRYFEEVIGNLNIIAPEIYATYPLDPRAPLATRLKQSDYFFHSDNSRHPRQIDILAHCNLEHPLEFYVPTHERASSQSDLLDGHQFPHHRKNKLDKLYNVCGATFTLEGPMKVHIRISANPADKCVYILLRNLEPQPTKQYKFSPEKVNDQLLDRLARILLREESKLVSVQVSNDFRSELRSKIEQEKRLQEKDLAEALAEIEAEKKQLEDAKLINRTKRAVDKGSKKLVKLASQLPNRIR